MFQSVRELSTIFHPDKYSNRETLEWNKITTNKKTSTHGFYVLLAKFMIGGGGYSVAGEGLFYRDQPSFWVTAGISNYFRVNNEV